MKNQKLKRLLLELDPEEESQQLIETMDELSSEVEAMGKKVDKMVDVEKIIQPIKSELRFLSEEINKPPTIIKGPPGPPGKTPTKAEIQALIPLPIPGVDGKSVKMEEVLDELKPFVLSRLPRGGGNMNRNIAINGNSSVLSRYTDINLKAGSNVTITAVNNNTTKYVDITITSSGGGGGSGYQAPLTGGLTGTNTWTTAPNALVIDGVTKQQTQTDGQVNWTGTTTTTLTGAQLPTFDIFAIG